VFLAQKYSFCKVKFAKYAEKHIKIFAHIKKKQYLCTGFQKRGSKIKQANLFCTLNKQTNT